MHSQLDKATSTRWADVHYETDAGIGPRAHIGMVVISNDQTLSHEARAMLKVPGVALYESRVGATRKRNQELSDDNLGALFDQIDLALRQINDMRPSDVIALGCTSAAMTIGPQELERRVRQVHPGARVTDPFTGILAALRALGSTRIGYVSPYPRAVAEKMTGAFSRSGYQVPVAISCHNEGSSVGDDSPFISPSSTSNAVREAIRSADVDTVVIACTQMRVAEIIDQLEQETGKAIVSSNQALCWHALRLAGCSDAVPGFGRLFQRS